jgi:hypothetical protein
MILYHVGRNNQRGSGLGSIVSSLWKRLIPLAKVGIHAGRRILQSDFTKTLANKSVNLGKDILKDATKNILLDVIDGKNLKNSAQSELDKAKKKISDAIMEGGGKKRKKTSKHNLRKKKRKLDCVEYNLLNDDA